jgi:hypothetical protein
MKVGHRKWLGAVLLAAGCAALPRPPGEAGPEPAPAADGLVIWMLSDIQPKSVAARKDFERAVDDVKAHVSRIDLAVIAGDLLQSHSTAADFDWFLATRRRAPVSHWFEIAGNHDMRNRELFARYFPVPAHYAVSVGNVLILLLSDETPSSETNLSDSAFEWWKQQVLANQDRIILTVTHAPLRHSGLFTASAASRRIRESSRFEAVLRKARVALWASGHSHLPQGFYRTASVNPRLGGTCFVNVSAIRADPFMDSQSRFLVFTEGSRLLKIRSRDHTTGRFNPRLDIVVTLDREFHGDGNGPRRVEE